MGKNDHSEELHVKIEAGQILNPDSFPSPNELVCVQVPKVFDQVAVRDCETVTVHLPVLSIPPNPIVTFRGAENFEIKKIIVLSKTDSMSRPGFKKLKLSVNVEFDVIYAVNGIPQPCKHVCVVFPLTINEIYCPDCLAEIGVIRYPEDPYTVDLDGNFIKVEAIIEAFHDEIVTAGADGSICYSLSLDIGGFFVVKCECIVQLLMPAYGYCPVPPEQQNPATQTCATFNNRRTTPFPTQFFPDQKWNPLDKGTKEDWDD